MFWQVVKQVGESATNYIKIFHNAKALEISVGNSYTEDQMMQTFSENFHQGGKYFSQIASHQAEFRREERFIDLKSLSISDLQIDYLDLENSVRNNEREIFLNQGAVTVVVYNQLRNTLSKSKSKKAIINHPLIHATLMISVLDVTVGNQIRA